jgi:hypothetical protein
VECEISKIRPSSTDYYNAKMYIGVTVKIHFLKKEKLYFYYCGTGYFDKVTGGTQHAKG